MVVRSGRSAHGGPGGHGRVSRVLGVDLGAVRIGLATSDTTRTVAGPHSVITRSGDPDRDRRAILSVAREEEVTTIVVGLPLTLTGGRGPAARGAEAEVEALRTLAPDLEVLLWDERMTDRKSTRLNSSHIPLSRMPSSA